MGIISLFKKLSVTLGIQPPLSFDQQVWGAKSVMDLIQNDSQFYIAQSTSGKSCYTCWLGSRDHRATALVVEPSGQVSSPFPDDSHIKGCDPWNYPPKISCAQAVAVMIKAGISESWKNCTLQKISGQPNPTYLFTFDSHAPVTVDATTGKII